MAAKRIYQEIAPVGVSEATPPVVGRLPEETAPKIHYPSSEGKPMADHNTQAITMHYADLALKEHFRAKGVQAYVTTDTLVFYENGKPDIRVVPDVMVVLGASDHVRSSYRLWREDEEAPDAVIEVLSASNHIKEEAKKREQYRVMEVKEYFRYVPEGDKMAPREGHRLVGLRLENGVWEEMPHQGDGSIFSEVLGLNPRVKAKKREQGWHELRFRDPDTGKDLPTGRETHAAKDRAEEVARQKREAKLRAQQGERREREAKHRAMRQARAAQRQVDEFRALLQSLQQEEPDP